MIGFAVMLVETGVLDNSRRNIITNTSAKTMVCQQKRELMRRERNPRAAGVNKGRRSEPCRIRGRAAMPSVNCRRRVQELGRAPYGFGDCRMGRLGQLPRQDPGATVPSVSRLRVALIRAPSCQAAANQQALVPDRCTISGDTSRPSCANI